MASDGSLRPIPPLVAGEREMLEGWLDFHRATLLGKCAGLDADQLAARSVPPSTLSLLGLVRHMSDVERHWFDRVLSGSTLEDRYRVAEVKDRDFDGAEPTGAAEALEAFVADCDRSRRIQAGVDSLDTLAAGEWRGLTVSARWILVHMIEEWCGHLAALTGLVARFAPTDRTIDSGDLDLTALHELVGPSEVQWREGMRRMVEACRPDLLAGSGTG